MSSAALKLLPVLGLATLILWSLGGYIVRPSIVAGGSMGPTLEDGDRVLVDVWSYRHRRPRSGEIALLVGPTDRPLVKRVIGDAASEDGRLWVEGDRRRVSGDSREFGPVATDRFLGRVIWRYWPPSRIGPLRTSRPPVRASEPPPKSLGESPG